MKTRIENGVTIITIEKNLTKSEVQGVYYLKRNQKYVAHIIVDKIEYHLGYHKTMSEAEAVKLEAEKHRNTDFLEWYKKWRSENHYKRK